ncbi:unnamed protein product [Ectocarpus sp. CCAP 1310/34]|nr:unnamed protein product [Ectocarpus sp. CCAP 1310/34]
MSSSRAADNALEHEMEDVRNKTELFEKAAQDRSLSSEHFFHLNKAIARAERELTVVTASEPDIRQGVDIVEKLRALVQGQQHIVTEDTIFSDKQAMGDLQMLLPGLGEVELREFLREFLHGLSGDRVSAAGQ